MSDLEVVGPLNSLAVVANLELRARSLLGKNYDPLLVESMSSIQVSFALKMMARNYYTRLKIVIIWKRLSTFLLQWCLLERIGRARHLGDVTQGKTSLTCLAHKMIPPKTQYYFRKKLVARGLITKQELYQKIKNQNVHGLLFHLPRSVTFYMCIVHCMF